MESQITTMGNLQALNQYNKRKKMKKILLLLLLIAASVRIIRLSAYCTYNYSNDGSITIQIYANKEYSKESPYAHREAKHVLSPKNGKSCWNWQSIDPNNRKKEWYWVAFKGGTQLREKWIDKLGEGYFPIGGAILFFGYDKDDGADFEIHFDNKKWKYQKSPWNHISRPWKTYKR